MISIFWDLQIYSHTHLNKTMQMRLLYLETVFDIHPLYIDHFWTVTVCRYHSAVFYSNLCWFDSKQFIVTQCSLYDRAFRLPGKQKRKGTGRSFMLTYVTICLHVYNFYLWTKWPHGLAKFVEPTIRVHSHSKTWQTLEEQQEQQKLSSCSGFRFWWLVFFVFIPICLRNFKVFLLPNNQINNEEDFAEWNI